MTRERVPAQTSASLVILAVVALGFALKWLAGILTPLALALFLAVMIDGLTRVLLRRVPSLNRKAALAAAIFISILAFVGSAYLIAANGADFVGQLLAYEPKMNALIGRVAHMIGGDAPATLQEAINRLNPTKYLGAVASSLQGFLSDAFFVLIYLGFLIAARSGFQRKAVALFPNGAERDQAVQVFHAIRAGVENYLWVQTVTGLMIAVASWVAMQAVGLDNAFFWAFLIFVASYIPIIGGVVGVALPPLFALLQFDTWWQAAVLLGVLQGVQFVVGNVVLPRMQGDSLNMDPVVVLLSLAFWSAIWGMAGAFLSTPLTVMAMVILAQFPSSRWLAVLLSADGRPEGRAKDVNRAFEPRRGDLPDSRNREDA